MFKPFLTLHTSQKKFIFHPTSQDQYSNQKVYFVSLIDIKGSDLTAMGHHFINTQQQGQLTDMHGIVVSDIFTENNKQFRYLYLPPLCGKAEQKFQDLFASICLTISNVCVFNISSKYIKLAQQGPSQSTFYRKNFLVLNSHGAELFRVRIHNKANKLEISDKLVPNPDKQLPDQILDSLKNGFQLFSISFLLKKILDTVASPKLVINFDEAKTHFLCRSRIYEHLQKYSNYKKLEFDKLKLSQSELASLQKQILSFQISEVNENFQHYIQTTKQLMARQLRQKNGDLTQQFLKKLVQQYYQPVDSLDELERINLKIKEILILYNVDVSNIDKICHKKYVQLVSKKLNSLNQELQGRQQQIQNSEKLQKQLHVEIDQLNSQLERVLEQNQSYQALNKAYLQVCQQLDREKQLNKKNKIQIESLMIERKARIQNEQRLETIIQRIREEKEILKKGIEQVSAQNSELNEEIEKKAMQVEEISVKLQDYYRLECEAKQTYQFSQICQQKLEKYEGFAKQFVENLDTFKNMEIKKINYILERNNKKHKKVIEEKKQLQKLIANKQQEMQRVEIQLAQSKMVIQHFQKMVFKQALIHPDKAHTEQPEPLKTHFPHF